eukprot:COSAG05_NODE_5026_length_1287_cov_0.769360_1_plen_201_part_00
MPYPCCAARRTVVTPQCTSAHTRGYAMINAVGSTSARAGRVSKVQSASVRSAESTASARRTGAPSCCQKYPWSTNDCVYSLCMCAPRLAGFHMRPQRRTCTCDGGFQGPQCDVNIDECASAPCTNDGTCVDGDSVYTCACKEGYTGTNCKENIDDCASGPCHNGGTCTDGHLAFSCLCGPAFSGVDCSVGVDECISQVIE